MIDLFNGFYKDKNILITGHTGFKGSWLALWLLELGANVVGYALEPTYHKDNFILSQLDQQITHIVGDIRSTDKLKKVFATYKPEIVFHLAAQPIVLLSYHQPQYTYEVNVMGTLNVLERIKETAETKAGIMVTSDKCYKNKEWIYGYKEDDELGGKDPYSSSKGCAEILISSYRDSYFNQREESHKMIAAVRAGNVIGGGDWSKNRIIPDCIKALEKNQKMNIRNPYAVRPWQHVLEPLYGYLKLASKCEEENVSTYSDAWNFGPDFDNIISVKELVQKVMVFWGEKENTVSFDNTIKKNEATLLNLDSTKSKYYLKWKPAWGINDTIEKTVEWYKNYTSQNPYHLCKNQIKAYCQQVKNTRDGSFCFF